MDDSPSEQFTVMMGIENDSCCVASVLFFV